MSSKYYLFHQGPGCERDDSEILVSVEEGDKGKDQEDLPQRKGHLLYDSGDEELNSKNLIVTRNRIPCLVLVSTVIQDKFLPSLLHLRTIVSSVNTHLMYDQI